MHVSVPPPLSIKRPLIVSMLPEALAGLGCMGEPACGLLKSCRIDPVLARRDATSTADSDDECVGVPAAGPVDGSDTCVPAGAVMLRLCMLPLTGVPGKDPASASLLFLESSWATAAERCWVLLREPYPALTGLLGEKGGSPIGCPAAVEDARCISGWPMLLLLPGCC